MLIVVMLMFVSLSVIFFVVLLSNKMLSIIMPSVISLNVKMVSAVLLIVVIF
jgi:hypothetical protein